MTLADPEFEIPPTYNYAMDKLHQLQAEFVVTARMWAIDEIGAAVAHQLNDPLTALFIYLHEIEQMGEQSPHANALPLPVREIVEKAAHEAKRACDILERLRQGIETPVDTQSAMARGRDAISALALGGRPNGGAVRPPPPPPSRELHSLTPREREVLAQVTAGASNKEGSHRLGISKRTFEAHRAHLMRKVGARNAADLVRTALSERR